MTQKARRILCALLTVFMLIPLCSAFAVTVGADAVTYDSAENGKLLRTINFKDSGWDNSLLSGNADATVVYADDGSSFKATVLNQNNKRAIWGGAPASDALPLGSGKNYTFLFDCQFGGGNMAVSFFPDGKNGLTIDRNGYLYWYEWNTVKVGKTSDNSKRWVYCNGDTDKSLQLKKQTFALEMDYDAKTYTLYVLNLKDGVSFEKVDTYSWDGAWDNTVTEMRYRFSVRRIGGTVGSSYWAEISNFQIFKGTGLATENGFALLYEDYQDGDKIKDVNFNAKGDWAPALSSNENYNDLEASVSSDGTAVTLTSLSTDYKRGIWGDDFEPTLPLSAGVKYTFYYHLEMEAGMRCAFYPDGGQGIAIFQNSTYAQYQSWATTSGSSASWSNKTDYGSDLKDFAVELDYDAQTLKLYGKNQNGLYSPIITKTGITWGDTVLNCRFYAGNTEGKKVTVSNFSVYKGLTVDVWDKDATGMTAYSAADEGALLEEVIFHDTIHTSSSDSYNDVAATVAPGGRSVTFTLQKNGSSDSNPRAVLYDTLDTALPLGGGVIYTFVFDVTFSTADVNVGIYPDGNSGIVIGGNGTVNWKEWNIGKNSMGAWTAHTDVEGLSQTFAAILNYSQKRFYLYVKQACGSFEYVGTMGYSGAWGEPEASLNSSFFVKGTATEQSVTLSNLNIYKGDSYAERNEFETLTGAEVRLDTPTGIRFTGVIGKDYLNGLKTTYGNKNVKIGMVITPTDYLTDNSLAFTMAALDGCSAITGTKYVKIEAVRILDQGNYYQINCVLANIKEDNYTREFSAITYIEINGTPSTYYYSKYVEANHSRSVAYVAAAALEDVSETQVAEYQYKVEENKYSPYTEAQRTTLQGFCASHTYSVMSYNIEMYDSTADWEGRDPKKVVATIKNSSPDIVGLQEVNGGWATDLGALNDDYTCVEGDTTANAWDNLYYKKDLFNCTESGTKNYKTLASTYSSVSKNNASIDEYDADMTRDNSKRMFTYAFLTDKNTGKKILAISTHLHYRKDSSDTASTAANSQVRAYELRLLDAWIKDQDSSKFDTVVIVGDMNEHYKSGNGKAVINEFKSLGYESAIETAAIRNGDMNNTLAVTNRTVLSTYVFDYIFTGGNTQTVSFSVIDNKIDNGNTSYPSDHLPVLAKIYCY